ncbi:CHAT domain-containing protein [candidate division KSB1 bacterium]|nr:CHAT domain-containing protein [candidate division KSB1 bacterium]
MGSNHLDVAISLNNLALLYEAQGNYAAAEPLLQRAFKIFERALGPDHIKVATSLNNLAQLYYMAQDKYAVADSLLQRALKIREQALGPNHPEVATSLTNLGHVNILLGHTQLAKQCFQRAVNIETTFMHNILAYSTETENFAFLQTQIGRLDLFMTLATHAIYTDSATIESVLDLTLQRKAINLDVSSQQRQVYFTSSDSLSRHLFERFRSLSQQIAHLTFRGPRDTAFTVYSQQLNNLYTEREQVEDSLAQRSGAFMQEQQVRKADALKVAAALPKGSILIEFIRYRKIDFKAKELNQLWGTARYAAFFLPAQRPNHLQIIDLGPAQPIDSLIDAYHNKIEIAKNLGKMPKQRDSAEKRLLNIAQQLYRFLFAPIEAMLSDSAIIYCVPEDLLHVLPFEILVDNTGKYLIENYQFNYLGSGRDLLRFNDASSSGKMYVFADPNFDDKPSIQITSNPATDRARPAENVQRSKDWQGEEFDPLDSTATEAKTIRSLFQLSDEQLFLNLKATEENLLSLKSPWRLHIATHGFFLKDLATIVSFDSSLTSFLTSNFEDPRLWQNIAKWENPLLRSGLALAGANLIGQKQDSTQVYDGIATAYEISGMNLQSTDLVVLSACETGLGDVQNGEGVFGLRRAFQLAGAQTVVMSLWKVPDNETKEMMIDFYTRLKNGEGKSQALRNAELAMMRKQKEKYGSAHPYFWGAFICAGNPE